MFRTVVATIFSGMMLFIVAAPLFAQPTPDHLKCFKVHDPQAHRLALCKSLARADEAVTRAATIRR